MEEEFPALHLDNEEDLTGGHKQRTPEETEMGMQTVFKNGLAVLLFSLIMG